MGRGNQMSLQNSDLLLERAYHWEATRPDDVYLTQPVTSSDVRDFTWRQTLDEARRMAAHLISLALPPNSNIAVFGKNSAHWIIADLAIMMAGHVSVPLYATLPSDVVRLILDHSEAKVMFVGKLDVWDEAKAGVPKGLPLISLPLAPPDSGTKWEEIVKETDPIPGSPTRDPDELASILYTSGTTGKPKGVMMSFGAMSNAPYYLTKVREYSTQERMISYLPLAHCFERCFVECTSLVYGYRLFFARELDTFIEDVQRAHPTVFVSVPRLWVKFQAGVLAKMPAEKLARLQRIPLLGWYVRRKVLKGLGLQDCHTAGSGAAPLPTEVIQWFRDLGLNLSEGYGMSENFGYSHVSPRDKAKLGTVGPPAPGVEVKIGEGGEVLVKSPSTMMGYYKEEELTREVFTEDGFIRTGDVGQMDDEGYLRITGRIKEIFKTAKGKYIAPAPIENKLVAHNLVEQACVTGTGLAQPIALTMLSPQGRAMANSDQGRDTIQQSLQSLLAGVNQELESHEKVHCLAVVKEDWAIENGFLTPTMKIKRNVLEDVYQKHYDNWFAENQPIVWETA